MPDSQSSQPGFESPLCYCFVDWAFLFSPLTPQFTQLHNWVPGYRPCWKCECLVIAHNCCMARMLPGESGLVLVMNRSVTGWSVKRFQRSNRLDTALYKNILFLIPLNVTDVMLYSYSWEDRGVWLVGLSDSSVTPCRYSRWLIRSTLRRHHQRTAVRWVGNWTIIDAFAM